MRANLDKEGKLIAPRNIERGRVRLKQLAHEIKKYPLPLALTGPSRRAYELLLREKTLVAEWLREKGAVVTERFRVSFIVEVEAEDDPSEQEVEEAVTEMVDLVREQHGGKFVACGIEITDAVEFSAEKA